MLEQHCHILSLQGDRVSTIFRDYDVTFLKLELLKLNCRDLELSLTLQVVRYHHLYTVRTHQTIECD